MGLAQRSNKRLVSLHFNFAYKVEYLAVLMSQTVYPNN